MDDRIWAANFLRKLADAVEDWSASDLEAFLTGTAELVISSDHSKSVRRSGKPHSRSKKQPERSTEDLLKLVDGLRGLASRDAGEALLNGAHLTKKELEKLSRLMDLPVQREDDSQRLRQRIVEESIGARLNSQAIRGR
jgi:hypothetical protein